ncbi:MAG: Na+/H+ antiporter NhaC [Eubacteriales bacterium]|nr:Na+/H+ antiporter NhaC [Eubacteriales bacterium]MDD4583195.1 Na+/H+ antiporter NhaC [Eubacteriales bacterium]
MGRKVPMWQVLIVIIVMLLLLFYEIMISNSGEAHIALIVAAIFAAIVAVANGWKWSFLEKGIVSAINRSMQAMLILMVVGLMIGSWIAGGVVPAMIYYGLMILSPGVFLMAGCLLCSIVSLATGSSWTTAGTIGVALIGVGMGLGINPAMTAGAIVSGAYFGDKMSPLSDTTNLAPAVAGSNLFEHIRHMIWTVTPSLIIALIIFTILGLGHADQVVDMSGVAILMDGLKDEFWISPLLLIPPLCVILMVAFKMPALPGLIGGTILGVIFMGIQGVSPVDWGSILNYGYESTSEITEIYELLTRGGMQGMMWTISLIMCAMTFGGIMDASEQLKSLADVLLKAAKGVGSTVLITIFSCIFVNIVACDQYLAIILPGRMYKEAFEDRRLKPKNLSRVLEDAGTMTSSLVPWNTCGATMSTFLGVPTFSYLPYAFLNLVNPIVSAFYGFTGISMEKMTEEEYKAILTQRELDKELALKALQ